MANFHPDMSGLWRGRSPGRPRGVPNKSTRRMRALLDEVFSQAFANPEFKAKLVEQITTLTIDTRLLALLLAYYAGKPTLAVDVTHGGTLSLAQIIAGTVPKDEDDEDDEDEDDVAGSRPS